jgi:hypothetical protein
LGRKPSLSITALHHTKYICPHCSTKGQATTTTDENELK